MLSLFLVEKQRRKKIACEQEKFSSKSFDQSMFWKMHCKVTLFFILVFLLYCFPEKVVIRFQSFLFFLNLAVPSKYFWSRLYFVITHFYTWQLSCLELCVVDGQCFFYLKAQIKFQLNPKLFYQTAFYCENRLRL